MRRTLIVVLALSVAISGLLFGEGAAEQEGQPVRMEMATSFNHFGAIKNDHPGHRVSCHGVA